MILKGLDENSKIIVGPFKALVSLKADQKLTDKEEKKKGAVDPNAGVRTASNEKPAEGADKKDSKAGSKPADSKPADSKSADSSKGKDSSVSTQASTPSETGKN